MCAGASRQKGRGLAWALNDTSENREPRTENRELFLHQLQKVPKQIKRIVRSRRGLGVVLHGDDRLAAMPETLERLIVQIDVRELNVALFQRIGIDCEAVVLRGDLHATAAQILHRMVA